MELAVQQHSVYGGYEALICAAKYVAPMVSIRFGEEWGVSRSELVDVALTEYAVDALIALAPQRAELLMQSLAELRLVECLEVAAGRPPPTQSDQRALWQRLWRAWQQLSSALSSNTLPKPEWEAMRSKAKRSDAATRELARAEAEAQGLKRCGLTSCGAEEVHAAQISRCSACKSVFYCRKEHR